MERFDKIIKHPLFIEHMEANGVTEKDRIFCRHDMNHALDVARIGRIMAAEEGYNVEMPLLYGAALLHDIGRHLQYEKGIPHEVASAQIAPVILEECGFSSREIKTIVEAIEGHRGEKKGSLKDGNASVETDCVESKTLAELLYRADKASRACYACEAKIKCNWDDAKKNLSLKY